MMQSPLVLFNTSAAAFLPLYYCITLWRAYFALRLTAFLLRLTALLLGLTAFLLQLTTLLLRLTTLANNWLALNYRLLSRQSLDPL